MKRGPLGRIMIARLPRAYPCAANEAGPQTPKPTMVDPRIPVVRQHWEFG